MATIDDIIANLAPGEVLKELVVGEEHMGFYVDRPGLTAEQIAAVRAHLVATRTVKMKQHVERCCSQLVADVYQSAYLAAIEAGSTERDATSAAAAAATAKTLDMTAMRDQALADVEAFGSNADKNALFRVWTR